MARHVNRRVGPDGPGEHPDQADPADVGIRRRLDHLGQQRSVRVAGQALSRVLPCGVNTSGSGCSGRRREARGDDLQQFQRADAGAAARRNHREERRAGDGLLQILDQHRLVDLLAAEVALHQRLVLGLLDDSLDQGAAQFLDRIGVRRVGRVGVGALAAGVLVVRLRQQPDQTGTRCESAGRYSGSTLSPNACCAAASALS